LFEFNKATLFLMGVRYAWSCKQAPQNRIY